MQNSEVTEIVLPAVPLTTFSPPHLDPGLSTDEISLDDVTTSSLTNGSPSSSVDVIARNRVLRSPDVSELDGNSIETASNV